MIFDIFSEFRQTLDGHNEFFKSLSPRPLQASESLKPFSDMCKAGTPHQTKTPPHQEIRILEDDTLRLRLEIPFFLTLRFLDLIIVDRILIEQPFGAKYVRCALVTLAVKSGLNPVPDPHSSRV